jgi:hypothetical protein
MILEERRDNPDQINQEEVQVHRVHQVVQADLRGVVRLRVHQVDQADLHQIDHHLRIELHHRVHQADLQEVALHRVHQVDQADHLLRVHQADQADLAIQVVIVQEVRDQVEAEVHGLEKMNNAMIAVLN